MDARFLILCVLSAVGFTWPLIVRYFGVPGPWIAITVSMSAAMVTVLGLSGSGGSAVPGIRLLLAGLGAGVFNGVGMICYGKLLGTSGADVSRIVPIVSGMMHILAFAGACLLLGEPATARKLIGVGSIVLGVYLLSSR